MFGQPNRSALPLKSMPARASCTVLVLAASAGGVSAGEIASTVFLSEGTVRNYLSSAIGKLGARNRSEALRTATDNGWL